MLNSFIRRMLGEIKSINLIHIQNKRRLLPRSGCEDLGEEGKRGGGNVAET